jgi:VWFA-related protein
MAQPQLDQPRVHITPSDHLRNPATPVRPNLRLDVRMVLVPVTVTDGSDRPIQNLTPESFRIFEDDIEQKIVSFALEEGPVSVVFIFDTSSSMKNRMEQSIKAIDQFLKTLMPGDEFALVRFSDNPTLAEDFTRDPDEILRSLSFVRPEGWTALHDAICLGVQRLKAAKNPRRALLVLTDGGDNNSRYSESEVQNLVRESDVRVYSIGLFERPKLLEQLAADSGGRAFYVHRLDELPSTIERLSREFRTQYVLGYSSGSRPNDGKYRRVKVEILGATKRMWNIFWRRGYFAPSN